jgi:hypothetical protein
VEHIFGKRLWISRTDELMQANEASQSTATPSETPENTTTQEEVKTDEQPN